MGTLKKLLLTRTTGSGHKFLYRVLVKETGDVTLITYSGRDNREKSKTYKYKISSQQIQKLNHLINRIDYFNLKKTEDRWKFNTPGCVTAVELKDGKKKLVKNLLTLSSYPKKLFYFEDRIDELLKIRQRYKPGYSTSLSYF